VKTERSVKRIENKPLKILLIIAGSLFTITGLIGIFVPILPTTPFLILASACFLRSSDRMYNWLLTNRLFGKYLKNYLDKKGIPLGVKIFTLGLLWFTILLSAFVFIDNIWIRAFLMLIAIGVTIHLIMIKTYEGPY
jgi:uncharacterized membrane protein YbaN (DUF454 family)